MDTIKTKCHGTQKARDGDPTEWLENRLSDLGMMESTNEAKEDCDCDCGKATHVKNVVSLIIK